LLFFLVLFKLINPKIRDKIVDVGGDKKNNIKNTLPPPISDNKKVLSNKAIKTGMVKINIANTKLQIANLSYFFVFVFLFIILPLSPAILFSLSQAQASWPGKASCCECETLFCCNIFNIVNLRAIVQFILFYDQVRVILYVQTCFAVPIG